MSVVIEKATAAWVIKKIQTMIDLYLGTDNSRGEVLTRGIGIYRKETFKTLLDYYAFKFLAERDTQLQGWGKLHFTDQEISHILEIVNAQIVEWTKDWASFTVKNPTVNISDISGKRSLVIPWIGMSSEVWKESRNICNTIVIDIKSKYSGYHIQPYYNPEEKELLISQYPTLKFAAMEDIKTETLSLAQDKLNKKADPDMISVWVDHILDGLYDIADTTIRDSKIKSRHKDIILQKQQDFIDYVTQQVFGDEGYLYGSNRENVQASIKQGTQPGISDFTNFLEMRAISEAYSKLNLADDKGFVYDRNDLAEVIELNKKLVREKAEPEYIATLLDNDIIVDDTVKNEAFGYKIPSQDDISTVDKRLEDSVEDILNKLDKSVYNTFEPDDLTDWYKTLKDQGQNIANEVKINETFVEPIVEAACNGLGTATAKKITTPPKITSTYKTASNTRDNNRITGWKRYYPSGYSDTERVSDWKRYYPGVIDDSQLNAGRISDFKRYYPYTPSDDTRVSDWKRYVPPYVSNDTRVASEDWQRYYPGAGQVASDFLPTYRTFSGNDMVVTVQIPLSNKTSVSKVIGAFQTISYSIHNEKAPVRVLGDMNVRRYVFGPRVIAGSLSLIVFDRHWMRELLDDYVKIKSETERYFLMDELPAMNITISAVNEYGHNAKLAIYGITIINEGQIMSINDLYTENVYEFVAMNIDYLDRIENVISQRRNKTLDNIPYEISNPDVDQKTTEESETAKPEVVDEEAAVLTVDPSTDIIPPEVVTAYDPDSRKWKEKYEDIIDKYNSGKISQSKALKKIASLEKKEKDDRFKQWLKDMYNPKYKSMLKKFGVKESDVKDLTKLQQKLGAEYDNFIATYDAFQNVYEHMKQLISEEVGIKVSDYNNDILRNNVTGGINEEDNNNDEIEEEIVVIFPEYDNGVPYLVESVQPEEGS